MRKLELIEGWHKWYRLWSIRLGLVGTAITAWFLAAPDAALSVWAIMPEDVKAVFPPDFVKYFGVGLLVLGTFARMVKQNKLREEVKPNASEDN